MKNQTKSVKNRNLNVYRVSTHDRRSKHTAQSCAHENKNFDLYILLKQKNICAIGFSRSYTNAS